MGAIGRAGEMVLGGGETASSTGGVSYRGDGIVDIRVEGVTAITTCGDIGGNGSFFRGTGGT